MSFNEAALEEAIIEMLGEQGYPHVVGEQIERSPQEVLIKEDLQNYQMLYRMREMAWLLLKHISTQQDVEAIQCYYGFKQELLDDLADASPLT